MKFKSFLLIFIACFFLQGYTYEYYVEPLNAANNAADKNNQGVAYMEMGHLNHAISAFKLAIALSPDAPASAVYHNNLGIAYMKIGAYSAAKPCFERAIELNPVFLEYYNNLVKVFEKEGLLESKLNEYLTIVETDRLNSYAYFMAGLIYKQLGDKENAINSFKTYISIEKQNVMSRAAKQLIFELKTEK